MNRDDKFYDLVDWYINTYNLTEDTAKQNAFDELGYQPKYARESHDMGDTCRNGKEWSKCDCC